MAGRSTPRAGHRAADCPQIGLVREADLSPRGPSVGTNTLTPQRLCFILPGVCGPPNRAEPPMHRRSD
jgi:hypothetical protein